MPAEDTTIRPFQAGFPEADPSSCTGGWGRPGGRSGRRSPTTPRARGWRWCKTLRPTGGPGTTGARRAGDLEPGQRRVGDVA